MAGELTISIRLEWEADNLTDGSLSWVDESIDVTSTDFFHKREEITTNQSVGDNLLSGVQTYAVGGYFIGYNAGHPDGDAKPVYIASDSGSDPLIKLLEGDVCVFRVSANCVSLRAHKDSADTGANTPILEWWYFEL